MRQGKCVKCGAATIRAARNGIASQTSHTTMNAHYEDRPRGIVVPFQGQVWQLVCVSCGYLEWWVLDPETLGFIRENWATVEPSQPAT